MKLQPARGRRPHLETIRENPPRRPYPKAEVAVERRPRKDDSVE
jgi:hypothetical protein